LESIDTIIKKNTGTCDLFIDVKTALNETMRMKSSKYKVKPDKEMISSLRTLLGKDNVKIAG
ncbi:hypothetical protein ACFL6I_28995, partial [candidate division KSB1 bacterium]